MSISTSSPSTLRVGAVLGEAVERGERVRRDRRAEPLDDIAVVVVVRRLDQDEAEPASLSPTGHVHPPSRPRWPSPYRRRSKNYTDFGRLSAAGFGGKTGRNTEQAADLLGLAVGFAGIEGPGRVLELERDRADLPQRHRPVEAGSPPGVAGSRSPLLDLDPDRVLVAVDAHLGDALGVAGAFALLPQLPGASATSTRPRRSRRCAAAPRSFMCATISTSPVQTSVATTGDEPVGSRTSARARGFPRRRALTVLRS